jgi:integrase
MKADEFPITVTELGVSAKIRKITKIKRGSRYPSFVVDYVCLGRRKQVWRSKLADARKAAHEACRKISNGDHLVLELKNSDRLTYLRATQLLAPIGVELDVAARDYVSAVKDLPDGATLKDAVDCIRHHNGVKLEKRTVRQVVSEMLAVKRTANLSEVHLADLKSRLNRFAEDFNKADIGDVKGKLIQAWLDAMNRSGRTKQNYLCAVAALFRFAIRRKYLPKDGIDEIKAVEKPKQNVGEVEIFTPGEIGEILSVARPEIIPCLAIGAFAGLRSFEIARLDWSEVNLAERHIEIKASKAKTAARRLAPVTENLAQWLTPRAKESGPVVNFEWWWHLIPTIVAKVNGQREAAAKEAGQDPAGAKKFSWKHNGLRHSFCSYRLAAIKNAAQVALEAGNSPQMVFQHYRQVVTETEAAKWFSIFPARRAVGRKLALAA